MKERLIVAALEETDFPGIKNSSVLARPSRPLVLIEDALRGKKEKTLYDISAPFLSFPVVLVIRGPHWSGAARNPLRPREE